MSGANWIQSGHRPVVPDIDIREVAWAKRAKTKPTQVIFGRPTPGESGGNARGNSAIPPPPGNAPMPDPSVGPLLEELKLAQRQLSEQMAVLSSAIEAFSNAKRQHASERSKEILAFGLAVAEVLAGSAIDIDPQRAVGIIEEAIGLLGEEERIQVRMNPKWIDILTQSGLLAEIQGRENIHFIKDASLEAHACVLESRSGRVDTGVHARLKRLESTLRRELGAE